MTAPNPAYGGRRPAATVLVSSLLTAAGGILLSALTLGVGLAGFHDPTVPCMYASSRGAQAILKSAPETTRIAGEFTLWPLGTRCTYQAPGSSHVYVESPDWTLSIVLAGALSVAAAAAVVSVASGIAVARTTTRND
jgi:hypothetical protein